MPKKKETTKDKTPKEASVIGKDYVPVEQQEMLDEEKERAKNK